MESDPMAAARVAIRRANSLTRGDSRTVCTRERAHSRGQAIYDSRTVCTRERAHSRGQAIYFAPISPQLASTWTGGKQLRGSEDQSEELRILVATPDEFP